MSTTKNPAHRGRFSFFCLLFSRGSALAEARFSSTNLEAYKTEVAVAHSNLYSLIPPKKKKTPNQPGKCIKQMMVINVPCHTYLRFKCFPSAAQFREGWCPSRLLFGVTGSSLPPQLSGGAFQAWSCPRHLPPGILPQQGRGSKLSRISVFEAFRRHKSTAPEDEQC